MGFTSYLFNGCLPSTIVYICLSVRVICAVWLVLVVGTVQNESR
jgi:hypothetical protein